MKHLMIVDKNDLREIIAEMIPTHNASTPTKVEDELLTTAQACEFLKCSVPTLQRWRISEKIPYKRLGKSIRFLKSDLEKAMNRK